MNIVDLFLLTTLKYNNSIVVVTSKPVIIKKWPSQLKRNAQESV